MLIQIQWLQEKELNDGHVGSFLNVFYKYNRELCNRSKQIICMNA